MLTREELLYINRILRGYKRCLQEIVTSDTTYEQAYCERILQKIAHSV